MILELGGTHGAHGVPPSLCISFMHKHIIFHHTDGIRRSRVTGCPAETQWALICGLLCPAAPGQALSWLFLRELLEALEGTFSVQLKSSERSECLISQRIEEPEKNLVSQGTGEFMVTLEPCTALWSVILF